MTLLLSTQANKKIEILTLQASARHIHQPVNEKLYNGKKQLQNTTMYVFVAS